MKLVSFKPLFTVFAALALLSAVGGAAVYYMHYGVLKSLASPTPSLGAILDSVDRLEYEVRVGGDVYRVVVDNSPSSRSGVAELYKAGELQYKIRYEYGENALTSMARIDPASGLETPMDVLRWEEAFLTGLSFAQGSQGEIIGVEVFPGIAPLYLHYYLSGALGIDWGQFIAQGAVSAAVRVNVSFQKVETPEGAKRGLQVVLLPQAAGLSQNLWAQAPLSMELARIDGLIAASKIRYDLAIPGQEDEGIEITLTLLQTTG
ncbi:hypothetical protein apy_10500 [Aeropyrum pernix]|uniref:Uncharacterized protein n=1 Tax=Aeropyrum pernix TaxID=56636 RepID=A0A401HA36_AERPX|nr:hypothetical protein [Aeropyrum pernix]GBF09325.1 hypothetical protein apy_10500 [Aeropyrum pernix]